MFVVMLSVLSIGSGFGSSPAYEYYKHNNPTLKELHDSEKNIYLMWWQSETLKDSVYLNACFETIMKNKGEFRPLIVTEDNWKSFFDADDMMPEELWNLEPAAMKDILLDLLLAKHGGVIMDFSMILFENLDKIWSQMIAKEAEARFYIYDPPGWGDQGNAMWFIMARKEAKPTMNYRKAIMSKQYNLEAYKKYIAKKKNWDPAYLTFATGIYNPILREFLKSRNLGSSSSSNAKGPENFVHNGVWFIRINDLPISQGPEHLRDSFEKNASENCANLWNEEMIVLKIFGGNGDWNPLKKLTNERLAKDTDEVFSVYYNIALDESVKAEKCKISGSAGNMTMMTLWMLPFMMF